METLDVKGWKLHNHHCPLARSAGKRHKGILELSHPFPASLTLPARLNVLSQYQGCLASCAQPSADTRALPPGSLSTCVAFRGMNRVKLLWFIGWSSGYICAA